jgi:hypothetical protein
MNVRVGFLTALISAAVSGCCIVGPCDRVAILSGRVTTFDEAPVSGAEVSWNGSQVITGKDGSFEIGGIDRGQYQLVISAQGFKRLCVAAKPTQLVTAVVVPRDSPQEGTAHSIAPREDRAALPGCP